MNAPVQQAYNGQPGPRPPSPAPRFTAPAAFAVLCLTGLALRLWFLARVSVSGDEAVFGLMSFAIARGKDYPIYCWGAHYASALISYLGVVSMALLGATPFGFKAATLVWNIAALLLVPIALRRDWGLARATAAGFALAIVPATFLEMTLAAHGGYPETFFLGPAIWFISMDLADSDHDPAIGRSSAALLVGFLAGASFAILWLGVPFLLAAAILLMARRALRRSELLLAVTGFLVGSLPFWIYNIWLSPAATLRRLGGRSLAAGADTPIAGAIVGRLMNLPRWANESAEGLAVLFAPLGGLIGLAVVMSAAAYGIRSMLNDSSRRRRNWALLVITFAVALVLFNVAGNLARPRHWTPLWLVLPFALLGLGRRSAPITLAALSLVTLSSTMSFIRETSPYEVIRESAYAIEVSRADALIADYDVGYPVAFALQGHIPTAAIAPPNPSDRRPAWTHQVATSRRPAALLLREDADRLLPVLVSAGWQFRRDDLGSRILVTVMGPPPVEGTDSRPGAWLLAQVAALDSAVAPSSSHP